MINVNNFKPGLTFKSKDDIYVVIKAQHSQQGRGQASVKVKIKNLRTGSTIYKTWTGGEKVEKAHIEKISMDYLFKNNDDLVFMDGKTYEQIEIPVSKLKWEINFLKEGQNILVRKYNDEILDIELPSSVLLTVLDAPDSVKGNSQSRPVKTAILETQYALDVPLFISSNDIVSVSTETGKYLGRQNK